MDGKAEDLNWDVFRDTLIEQAEQGGPLYNSTGALKEHIPQRKTLPELQVVRSICYWHRAMMKDFFARANLMKIYYESV